MEINNNNNNIKEDDVLRTTKNTTTTATTPSSNLKTHHQYSAKYKHSLVLSDRINGSVGSENGILTQKELMSTFKYKTTKTPRTKIQPTIDHLFPSQSTKKQQQQQQQIQQQQQQQQQQQHTINKNVQNQQLPDQQIEEKFDKLEKKRVLKSKSKKQLFPINYQSYSSSSSSSLLSSPSLSPSSSSFLNINSNSNGNNFPFAPILAPIEFLSSNNENVIQPLTSPSTNFDGNKKKVKSQFIMESLDKRINN